MTLITHDVHQSISTWGQRADDLPRIEAIDPGRSKNLCPHRVQLRQMHLTLGEEITLQKKLEKIVPRTES